MSDEILSGELRGRAVQNAARPEWGVGKVVDVQPTKVGGSPAQRVTVQFSMGRRTMMVPPAKLIAPQAEPTRASGWLEQAAGTALDDRLREVPEEIAMTLGSPRARFAAVLTLFKYTGEHESLLRWARDQTGVADPLSHWSRDELEVAWRDFCANRDLMLRTHAATVRQKEGADGLRELLGTIPREIQPAAQAALRRIL